MRSSIALVLAAAVVFGAGGAGAGHVKDTPRKHKIVYHLTEAGVDKAKFVLGNIQNHIAGVGGVEHVEALELVVHGPALRTFIVATMDPGVKEALDRVQAQGVRFGACGNTMKGFNLTLGDLPRGAIPLPQGGVVRVMELQEQGYVYIRP